MSCEIHVGDIGTVFVVTIIDCKSGLPIDLTSATIKKIKFLDPDLNLVEKDAEFVTNGSEGKIKYTTILDDLDKAGTWKIQGFVTITDGTWSSIIGEFTVHKNL